MKKAILCVILLLTFITSSFSDNTHGQPNPQAELQSFWGDAFGAFVVSGCQPAVPSSSLIFGAFACNGYVKGSSGDLTYVTQSAVTLTLANVTGTHWLALHHDTSSVVSGWSRRAGSHYLFQQTTAQPADPAGGVVFAKATVAGGVI